MARWCRVVVCGPAFFYLLTLMLTLMVTLPVQAQSVGEARSPEQVLQDRLRQQRRDFYLRQKQQQRAYAARQQSAQTHRQGRVQSAQKKNKIRLQFVRKGQNTQQKQKQKQQHLKVKNQAQVQKLKLAKKQSKLQKRLQPIEDELDSLYERAVFESPGRRRPQSTPDVKKGAKKDGGIAEKRAHPKKKLASNEFSKKEPARKGVKFKKRSIYVGDKKIQVEWAETARQQAQGLMRRRHLPPNQGMLFVYNKPQVLSFWMKNTLIPLSIGFFDADKKLMQIQQMPVHKGSGRPPSYKSLRPAQYALEMNKGWFKKNKISVGVSLKIK